MTRNPAAPSGSNVQERAVSEEKLERMLAQWEKPDRVGVMLPGTQMTCDQVAVHIRAAITVAGRVQVEAAIDEGLEILTNLTDSIGRHGNYSPESTVAFIDQAGQCFREARLALRQQESRTS